ncbi:hypothetical protein GCM10010520_55080 [Rhizobium viscosum]|uniref:GNAT family N-acyltransferase n=1 Tax=Rhizobium viscosum TaxID=1673 RepID=A0ABR9IZQ0_RHIVS|nr:hypothetical protein [Rhizobium viscosum]MBE1508693.1 putative GNAT family N-acyltransferase [Rhizobium viscosum]
MKVTRHPLDAAHAETLELLKISSSPETDAKSRTLAIKMQNLAATARLDPEQSALLRADFGKLLARANVRSNISPFDIQKAALR